MTLPLSVLVSLYFEAVAPEIATPDRYHWYDNVTGAGPQVPGFAVSVYPTFTVPVTVGVGVGVNVPATTATVATDVLATVVYPVREPVTRTETCAPASAPLSVYVDAVAPEIATPDRYHWYASVTGAGPHVPGTAVSVYPTFTVPVTVGVGVGVNVPATTATVATEVFDTAVYPVREPVTRTETCAPASDPLSVYVDAVAPEIATPARYHWYASVTGAGPHVPGTAVSLYPTFTVPEIVGVGVAVSAAAATTAVGADDLDVVVKPVLVPVTLTVTVLPRSATTGVNVVPVAPLIATPLTYHWYASPTGAGPQAPAVAVSAEATRAVPVMTGTVPVTTAPVTTLVCADSRLVVGYPVKVPVTRTLIRPPPSSLRTA